MTPSVPLSPLRILLATLVPASVFAVALLLGGVAGCDGLKVAAPEDAAPAEAGDAGPGESPFELVHSLPDGPMLNAVWGVDDDTVFAVGEAGVKYFSAGGTFLRTATTAGRDYVHVWGTGPNDVYAVGVVNSNNSGIIEHYNGKSWTDEYVSPTPLYSIWGNAQIVLAVGPGGLIYGKKTGTTDWGQRGSLDQPDVPALVSVTGNGLNNVTFVADKRIYHTTNFGDFAWFEPAVDTSLRFLYAWAEPGKDTSVFLGLNHLGVAWMYSPGVLTANELDAGSLIEPGSAIEDVNVAFLHRDDTSPASANEFIRGITGEGRKRYFVGDRGAVLAFDLVSTDITTIESGTRDSLGGAWASKTTLWVVGSHELVLKAPLP
ncbi:MAG: hypothetical protein JWP97_4639 [Labilithrix sp.]|nr:hypothetical protein [Labilithrix sp.]